MDQIHYGSVSFSLLKFNLYNFNSIYIFNIIPFSILIYQVYEKKNYLSYYFICFSIVFILFFSFLHPFFNGVILNHLHNTELDTVAMVFFILSFYLFLKYFENKNENTLKLLFLSSAICFFIRLSYSGVVVFPILIIFLFYKKKFYY